MLLAIWLFETACCVLVISLPRASAAIKPAGLSAPELICLPVLRRVNAVCRLVFDELSDYCASNELMLVLIRDMQHTPPKKVYVQAAPDCGGMHVSGMSFPLRR